MRREMHAGENLWKGLLAGVAAGLIASAAVSGFQILWTALEPNGSDNEEPTETAARRISEGVFDHALTHREKAIAGLGVYLGFGTAIGGLYGAAAELFPKIGLGGGVPFGAALWLAADEGALPALGLSGPALQKPAAKHVHDLATHLVFGFTAEATRRVVRSGLG